MQFLGVLLLLFLVTIRPQDLLHGLSGLPLVQGVMILLIPGMFLPFERERFLRTPIDKFFVFFYVSILLSTIQVRWLSYSIGTAVEFGKIVLIYFLVNNAIDNDRKLRITCWTLVGLMTLLGVFGIMQYYGYDVTGKGMIYSDAKNLWQIRYVGNFDNPNDLAYSVILSALFSVMFILSRVDIVKKIVLTAIAAISFCCVVFTNSRGGLLALMVGIASIMYFKINRKILKRMIVAVGAATVLGVVIYSSTMAGVTSYQGDKSAMERVEAWATGIGLLQEHPVLGVGYKQFREHYKRDSHSSYVRAGAELGALGMYVWIGLIYFSMKGLFEHDVRGGEGRTGFGIAMISFLVTYVVASIFSTRTYDIVFIICLAIISSSLKIGGEVVDGSSGGDSATANAITKKDLLSVLAFEAVALLFLKFFLLMTW